MSMEQRAAPLHGIDRWSASVTDAVFGGTVEVGGAQLLGGRKTPRKC